MGELYEVLSHAFAGRLKPVVDRVFPLSEIRAAHEYLKGCQISGGCPRLLLIERPRRTW